MNAICNSPDLSTLPTLLNYILIKIYFLPVNNHLLPTINTIYSIITTYCAF